MRKTKNKTNLFKRHKKRMNRLDKKLNKKPNRKIITSLGEAELKAEDYVQVYVTNSVSVLKPVSDLTTGDRVLFKKNNITTTLKDVVPLLEENALYRHAREQIFHRFNSDEDRVTLLRKYLLDGLQENGYLPNNESVNQRIVMNNEDLTKKEKNSAIDGLETILGQESEAEIPCKSTFNNWIGNESVLCQKRYLPLAIKVNSQLADFSEDGEKGQAYDFWSACRKQVMRGLRKGHLNGTNGKKESNGGIRGASRVVVEDIVGQIIEDYDSETAIAQVVSNEESDLGNILESAIKIKGKENPINMKQIFTDNLVLESYLIPSLNAYLLAEGFQQEQLPLLENIIVRSWLRKSNTNETYVQSWGDDSDITSLVEKTLPFKDKDKIISDILNNIPDKILGYSPGTTRKLLGYLSNLSSTLPVEAAEFAKLENESESLLKLPEEQGMSDWRNEYRDKFIEISSRLEKKYGISMLESYQNIPLFKILNIQGSNLNSLNERSDEFKAELIKTIKENGKKILTKKEIQESLKRYGLESILEKNPANFILEDGVEPMIEQNDELIESIIDYNNNASPKEKQKPNYSNLKPNPQKKTDKSFLSNATKQHDALVGKLLENPELIEAGFIPEKAEYDFAEGWARADIFGYDSNYNPVMVEVKQNAILNGNGFDNGLKGLQQTTGYKSSQQATVDYYFRKCPLLKETLNTFEKPKARGILAAYEIDENVKEALNENGAEYKIIDKEKIK